MATATTPEHLQLKLQERLNIVLSFKLENDSESRKHSEKIDKLKRDFPNFKFLFMHFDSWPAFCRENQIGNFYFVSFYKEGTKVFSGEAKDVKGLKKILLSYHTDVTQKKYDLRNKKK